MPAFGIRILVPARLIWALRDRQLTAITTLHLVGRLLSGNFQQPQQRNAAVREIGAGMAANDY